MSTASHSPVTCGYEQHTLWYPDTQPKPKQKKPWSTFVRKDIRLFGNNKTHRTPKDKDYGRRNITKIGPLLDTVRGCPFTAVYGGRGCYGHCYLAESMARYHIKHWVPVPNRFNEQLLAKDLERLEWDFVRNGVMGDPSLDWLLAVRVAEFCDTFDKETVILTRFLVEAINPALYRFARIGAIIHGSVSALDPPQHRDRILRNLWQYEKAGGRAVPRVITAWFSDERPDLWEVQDELMSLNRAFQQPLRIRGNSPVNKWLDLNRYFPTFSNTDGRLTNRWRSAHDLYGSRGCYTKCYSCMNRCMTNPRVWGVWG